MSTAKQRLEGTLDFLEELHRFMLAGFTQPLDRSEDPKGEGESRPRPTKGISRSARSDGTRGPDGPHLEDDGNPANQAAKTT